MIEQPDRDKDFDFAQVERGLRGPRYRWELASELPFNCWDPWMQRYDEYVRNAHHFLELVAHSPVSAKQAQTLYPSIAAAVALDKEPAKVAQLKIAVFGDLDQAEIVRAWTSTPRCWRRGNHCFMTCAKLVTPWVGSRHTSSAGNSPSVTSTLPPS